MNDVFLAVVAGLAILGLSLAFSILVEKENEATVFVILRAIEYGRQQERKRTTRS